MKTEYLCIYCITLFFHLVLCAQVVIYSGENNIMLYDHSVQKDNCGFGLIAHQHGEASHKLVKTAIHALDRMQHRGGIAADGKTGIIMYGSEVWGVYDYKEIDNLHLKFCKLVLGVKPQTSHVAILGELGRFPLSVLCKERSLKYWINKMKNPDSLVHKIFVNHRNVFVNSNANVYYSSLKRLLNNLGFGNILNDFNFETNYLPSLLQRVRDQYIQTWHDTLSNQSKMEYLCLYKNDFEHENYIDIVKNEKYRKELSRFRLSSHSLYIETGRYENVNRQDRLCKVCTQNVLESEYHFLLCCSAYSELRVKYSIRSSWPLNT